MEMMLLGEKIFAPQALQWGMINRMTSAADLMPTALKLAAHLANGPTRTLAMIRKIAWSGLDNSWDDQLHLERVSQRDAGRTADFREGVSAFLTKRPAQFTGA
jgi:2-(1,2-epoxy-1,2-dihydrophenyl)acetyl-CoA isomerase